MKDEEKTSCKVRECNIVAPHNAAHGLCQRHRLIERVYGCPEFETEERTVDLQRKAPPGRSTFDESRLELNRRSYKEAIRGSVADPQSDSDQAETEAKGYPPEQDSKSFQPRAFGPNFNRKKHKPATGLQNKLLDKYEWRCVYCRHKFGSAISRHGETIFLALHWDHFVPFADGRANIDSENWLPACDVCNQIKADKYFDSFEKAATYIMKRRIRKGYSPP